MAVCASTGVRSWACLRHSGRRKSTGGLPRPIATLRKFGVFYRVYEDPAGAVRPWPFSHVPLLIDATEWQALKAGLISAPSCSSESLRKDYLRTR